MDNPIPEPVQRHHQQKISSINEPYNEHCGKIIAQCDSSTNSRHRNLSSSHQTNETFSITSSTEEQFWNEDRRFNRTELIQQQNAAAELTGTNHTTSSSINTKNGQVKFKMRRHKANARERYRMHGLNAALDRLREFVPLSSRTQKLSKIETLRLASNYIKTLGDILKDNGHNNMDSTHLGKILTRGLSQGTTNIITSFLGLNPKTFAAQHGTKPVQFGVFEPKGLLADYNNTSNSATNNHYYFQTPSPCLQGANNFSPYYHYHNSEVTNIWNSNELNEQTTSATSPHIFKEHHHQ